MFFSHKGMTFVELLVSTVVITLVAGGALNAFVTARRYIYRNSLKIEALYLCQSTIEKFRSEDYDDLLADGVSYPEPLPDSSRLKNKNSGSMTYTITEVDYDGNALLRMQSI